MPTCCEDEEEWEHGSQPHRFHVRGHQYQYPVRTRLGHIESEGPPNGSRLSCGRLARLRKKHRKTSWEGKGATVQLPYRTKKNASFKRLLGRTFTSLCQQAGTQP